MANPIRIHTHLSEQAKVLTLYFRNEWVTMAHLDGKTFDTAEARDLEEGGLNHLRLARKLREKIKAQESLGSFQDDMGRGDVD